MSTTFKTNLWRWTESLVLSALFITISILLHDPLSLKSPFPWIWFAPVLIALRYGLWLSQLSILLLLSSYLVNNPTALLQMHFQLFILGGFVLTLICAAIQSAWSKNIRDYREVSNYLQTRIQTIAYAYKIISLAHHRLEQNYIVKPVTVRSSLSELREMIAKRESNIDEPILNRFLTILALHCSFETAAIFPVKNNQIIPQPITSLGKITTPTQHDFLIQECLKKTTMTYISAEAIPQGKSSNYLIAAPLTNQENIIYALLIVEAMPFLSLNQSSIETIHLFMSYFLEGNTVKNAQLILQRYPDCPVNFANELERLSHLQKKTAKDSVMVAYIILPHPHQNDYLFRLKQEKRGLDVLWEHTLGDKKILFLLMPILQHAGLESYKLRINALLKNEFEITLNESAIKFKSCLLSSFNNMLHLIQDLLIHQ